VTASVLAIDGGGSKTDVALVARDGSLLASVRGTATNPDNVGIDAATAELVRLVRAAAERAGFAAGGPVAAHTSACLAGADLPSQEADLSARLQALGWAASTTVVNDTFAVLRTGLDDRAAESRWGIGVVCGHGINCAGVAPDGRMFRFLSFGDISGDWGGSSDLGPEALWWAIRAEDGRGPQTALRPAIARHFGVERLRDVAIGLRFGSISFDKRNALTPVLFEVARLGDDVARAIVLRQADEVCAMVMAAARELGLIGGGPDAAPVPLVLGGSVLAARDPLLTAAITDRLAAELPRGQIRIVDLPPVIGAALLGLDHLGAPPGAAARLRECARVIG
jgi:N-acetylglucosamine kinase-like BadF-type ATPase